VIRVATLVLQPEFARERPAALSGCTAKPCPAAGFTLVELAVVLAVITILLAMVLKSSSVSDSAKANDIIAIAGDLSEAARQYRDKFKYLPGDDPSASVNLGPPIVPAQQGDGNGLIDFNVANIMEPQLAALHLFQAGMIRATPDAANNPLGTYLLKSHYGNVWLMAFAVAANGGGAGASPCGTAVQGGAAAPKALNMIVFANVPSSVAQQIDARFDDGNPASGSIRASAAYNTAPGTPAVACFGMPL